MGRDKRKRKSPPRACHIKQFLFPVMISKYFLNSNTPTLLRIGRSSTFSDIISCSSSRPAPAELTSHPQVLEQTSWSLLVNPRLCWHFTQVTDYTCLGHKAAIKRDSGSSLDRKRINSVALYF